MGEFQIINFMNLWLKTVIFFTPFNLLYAILAQEYFSRKNACIITSAMLIYIKDATLYWSTTSEL